VAVSCSFNRRLADVLKANPADYLAIVSWVSRRYLGDVLQLPCRRLESQSGQGFFCCLFSVLLAS
jgi:hypothetical protein